MTNSKFTAGVFGVIGAVVPVILLVARNVDFGKDFADAIMLWVWPSYLILGGLSGPLDGVVIAYLIVSIVINIGLYAYVGVLIARLFESRQSKRLKAGSKGPGSNN